MSDYTDKDFTEIYEDIISNVKGLTTKWDPSTSDESDPGVVILKTLGLLADKLNYKINYRNSQNSVEGVTDYTEGERLFNELGYQIKKKRSASGEINVKYLGEDSIDIPLFTEFTNSSGTITFTSIRSFVNIPKGGSKSIKVQEGVPTRYVYEGVELFTTDHLTNNLRLPLKGLSDVSDNGIVLVSKSYLDTNFSASDWLNVGEGFFNSVETNNLFSIGNDSEGEPYIQFYEESLPKLKEGVAIWNITSSGSAGNLSSNKINKISSTLENGDSSAVAISHPEFINGSDREDLKSALRNYHQTYGVNETLVSERDYETAISEVLDPNLSRIISKALVTGVDGNHNLVEILTILSDDKRAILTRTILTTLISKVLVNALKYSDSYYESFKSLNTLEIERLIKKALFKKDVVTNDLYLVGRNSNEIESSEGISLYDKFIFDIVSPVGTIFAGTTYTEAEITEKVIEAISAGFNSRNLVAGEMVSEKELSDLVKEKVPSIKNVSFYYKDHSLAKEVKSVGDDNRDLDITSSALSLDEKRDIVARTVLKGEVPLFKESGLQVVPGSQGEVNYPETGKKIKRVIGGYNLSSSGTASSLSKNSFIQFYKKSFVEDLRYGYGIKYILLTSNQTTLKENTYIIKNVNTLLKSGSVIRSGSKLLASDLNLQDHGDILNYLSEETLANLLDEEGNLKEYNGYCVFSKDYKVQSGITITGEKTEDPVSNGNVFLSTGSVIYDGSEINGSVINSLVIVDGDGEVTLKEGDQLIIQPSDVTSRISYGKGTTLKLDGFRDGKTLVSQGTTVNLNTAVANNLVMNSIDSTKTIYIMKYDGDFILDSNFRYGIHINEGDNIIIPSKGSYILKEGEHLIYSDNDLLDFIDLGSGTLLENGSAYDIVLNNLVNLSSETLAKDLKNLENEFRVFNTEITTFIKEENGDDIEVKFSNWPDTGYTNLNWEKIPESSEIEVKVKENTYTFGNDYFHREGLIIKTGNSNTMNLPQSSYLSVVYDSGETSQLITGNSNRIISFNQPLFINSLDTDLSQLNLEFVVYDIRSFTSSSSIRGISSPYGSNSVLGLELLSNASNLAEGSFILKRGALYLFEVEAKVTSTFNIGSATGTSTEEPVTLKLLNHSETKFPPTLNQNRPVLVNNLSSGKYLVLALDPSFSQSTCFTLSFNSGCKKGDTIEITKFKIFEGINPIIFSESNSGEYSASTKPSLASNSTLESDKLINRIMYLTTGTGDSELAFDFLYEPASPMKSPTDPIKVYDSTHILNRNILTVFDLKYLRNNLRIIRR